MTVTAFAKADQHLGPSFVLSGFSVGSEDGGDVNLQVAMRDDPRADVAASNALLYILAIMSLDKYGVIDEVMTKIASHGVMSELQCVTTITKLMEEMT